ncbi:hypothetical protein ACO0LG_01495 [Undibacterium sp. Ji42W]|uniref:hypothetical protein n=1 Tax=Undibacterium sp. Ji42W TaxID=3413039 RepID=UPI003BF03D65
MKAVLQKMVWQVCWQLLLEGLGFLAKVMGRECELLYLYLIAFYASSLIEVHVKNQSVCFTQKLQFIVNSTNFCVLPAF